MGQQFICMTPRPKPHCSHLSTPSWFAGGCMKIAHTPPMSRHPPQEAWTIDWLNSELMINLGLAINHSTHESYSSTLTLYHTFCHLHGFDIEPTQCTLAYYVTFQSSYINPNPLTVIYLASVTSWNHTSLTYGMCTSH